MTKPALFVLAALIALSPPQAKAIEDVTGMTTTLVPGTSSSAEGYIFENAQRPLTAISTAVNDYAVVALANNVFVRRNSVNPNQSSVWYGSSGTGTNLAGVHQNNYGPLLIANNLNAGSDNTFANGSTGTTIGNIERLDFTWNSPLTVSDGLAFAVLDRGVATVHDSFAIAPITAVDAFGNPTAFGSLLRVAAGWGGAINPIADLDYRLFRYGNGDIIDATTDSAGTATQGIGGVLVKALDLGLVSGMQIFGYSLMGADVTASNSTQLLDWTNSTYYPTTTDAATGGGGIDLAAVNGLALMAVPEPATWALLFMGGGLFAGLKRLRKRQALS